MLRTCICVSGIVCPAAEMVLFTLSFAVAGAMVNVLAFQVWLVPSRVPEYALPPLSSPAVKLLPSVTMPTRLSALERSTGIVALGETTLAEELAVQTAAGCSNCRGTGSRAGCGVKSRGNSTSHPHHLRRGSRQSLVATSSGCRTGPPTKQ